MVKKMNVGNIKLTMQVNGQKGKGEYRSHRLISLGKNSQQRHAMRKIVCKDQTSHDLIRGCGTWAHSDRYGGWRAQEIWVCVGALDPSSWALSFKKQKDEFVSTLTRNDVGAWVCPNEFVGGWPCSISIGKMLKCVFCFCLHDAYTRTHLPLYT